MAGQQEREREQGQRSAAQSEIRVGDADADAVFYQQSECMWMRSYGTVGLKKSGSWPLVWPE